MHKQAFGALLRLELTDYIRSSRGIIGLAVFLFFGLQSPVLARYLPLIMQYIGENQNIQMILPEPAVVDAYNQFIKNISQVCVLVLIFLTMGTVAGDKEKGVLNQILVRPVPRSLVLCSKFLGAALFTATCLGVTALVTGFYTALLFPDFSVYSFTVLNLLLLLYLFSFLFITVFFSTLMPAQTSAAIVSLLVWIGLSLVPSLGKWGLYSPGALTGELIPLLNRMPLAWEPFAGAFAVMLLSVAGSILVFRKWEA